MDREPDKWAMNQWRLNHHRLDSEELFYWNSRVRDSLLPDVSASPTLKLVFVFNSRLHSAALLMGAAFHEASVSDFELPRQHRSSGYRTQRKRNWYSHIVDDCLARSKEVRNALLHRWTPTPRAEQLAIDAFVLLTELTPARTELLRLCQYDRPRAFSELAKHIDLAADQFQLSADLLAEVEGGGSAIESSDEQRFSSISTALLERAGGGISLTEGAKLLGTTRQALHKRVKLGSALGLMHGSEIVLPRFQFLALDGGTRLVDGLVKVTRLFDDSGAGRWSMLQFMIEADPNLAETPLRVLSEGRVEEVVAAAQAYLGTDEG
ncbi:hypothetical protein G6M70_04785 [Agrobacterium tumefaciens]|uniref:hypothetical protein n=1 Tax=Agrobacterium tumefaciens TaxID=358 RepID=UPI0015721ACF|nr:hypothetical protein [Agrobacterium tumefaciens]NSZ39761.1 hypothetical protein [Agrobacterium tumefaciens]NTB26719.1 hypothetical protein [Agrobacterium tumefaciens]NTB29952.1 hypothetical protein [Agrobacterium tumefaciens]NTB34332.1 hypothetical protein [Agrobacterium tumefaciens]